MEQCDESCEHKARSNKRIAFMAERMSLLLLELVRRDFDYGRFCFEEFYTDEVAGYLQQGREYKVCVDFVRMMLKKHDQREKENEELRDRLDESADGEGHQGDSGSLPAADLGGPGESEPAVRSDPAPDSGGE